MKAFRAGCLAIVGVVLVLLLASVGWFTWQGSDASLPPLAKGMPNSFADGDRVFKNRMARLYPLGSSAQRLESDLKVQGFSVAAFDERPGQTSRVADLHRFIGCGDKVWQVNWQAVGDKLTEVSATFGPVCM